MNAPRFNRRTADRSPVNTAVELGIGARRIPAQLENLSATGALVSVDPTTMDLATDYIEGFYIPGHPPVGVVAKWAFFKGIVGLRFVDPEAAAPVVDAILEA